MDGNGVVNQTEILQTNHYYPFGMVMEGNRVNQQGITNHYQYNGKELNTDFGLDWLDYGARWYDASIARWSAVDPLAEIPENISWSPYTYVWNNPINAIDPDGENGELVIDKENGTVTIKMDLYFHGSSTNDDFDASGIASDIQSQWNDGAKDVKITIDGEEYGVNFEITGQVISDSDVKKKKKEVKNDKQFGDGTSWARANFIEVGEGLPNQTITSNSVTLKPNADKTAQAHEVGHLLGLRHPGDPEKAYPVEGQPGIMATVYNTVDKEYSVDGKKTKWNMKDGKPDRPTEGKLDITKRKVLPSEVKRMLSSRKIKGRTGNKAYISGIYK